MLHASRALLKEPQAVVCKGGYWVEEFNSLLTFLRDARLCTTEPLQVGESTIASRADPYYLRRCRPAALARLRLTDRS